MIFIETTDPSPINSPTQRPLATYPPTNRMAIINLHQYRRPYSEHILLNENDNS